MLKKVKDFKRAKTKAVLLLSDVTTNSSSVFIRIAKAKNQYIPKLKLIGLMALAESKILAEKAFDKMIIINPCLNENFNYTRSAQRRWHQSIYWKTATVYDAAQALIAAIEKSPHPTRAEILKNLATVDLPIAQTSGFGLH